MRCHCLVSSRGAESDGSPEVGGPGLAVSLPFTHKNQGYKSKSKATQRIQLTPVAKLPFAKLPFAEHDMRFSPYWF